MGNSNAAARYAREVQVKTVERHACLQDERQRGEVELTPFKPCY